MRHRKRTAKLGRTSEHRQSMLANLVCSLIKNHPHSVTTTVAKARAARVLAEKMVTLAKKGTLHHRRLVAARLRQSPRRHFVGQPDLAGRKSPRVTGRQLREQWREQHDVVHILFDRLAPLMKDRPGGYLRIVKLPPYKVVHSQGKTRNVAWGRRRGDAAEMAIVEWVDQGEAAVEEAAPVVEVETKTEPAEESKAEEAPTEEVAESEAEKADDEDEKTKDDYKKFHEQLLAVRLPGVQVDPEDLPLNILP